MDPKILMLAISLAVGYPSSIAVIWLNMSTWKADVIWALAGIFWVFKLVRACFKWHQEWKEKQIEIQDKKQRYNQK